jgi:hypothetical protein
MSRFISLIGVFLWNCAYIRQRDQPLETAWGSPPSARSPRAATLPKRFSSPGAWSSIRYMCRLASIPGLLRVSPPFVFLLDCEPLEANNRTTLLTLQIELEDDFEALPSPLGPLPPRRAR